MCMQADVPCLSPGRQACLPPAGYIIYVLTLPGANVSSPRSQLRFFLFKRGRRPELLQNMLDLRKRLRGVPKGPNVSIVVTDIEDFSSESDNQVSVCLEASMIFNLVSFFLPIALDSLLLTYT